MLSNSNFKFGPLGGTIYDFSDAGDVLERHVHETEQTSHITVVARGSFKIRGDDWEHIAKLGQVINFPAGQYHEFEALEPGSRAVNIIKAAQE